MFTIVYYFIIHIFNYSDTHYYTHTSNQWRTFNLNLGGEGFNKNNHHKNLPFETTHFPYKQTHININR